MMTATNPLRSAALLALTAPLALVLSGCGSSGADAALPEGEAVAKVPPPSGQQWSDVVSATPDGGMLMGNPEAPIKVLEYGSLSCPACAKLAQDGMTPLVDNYVDSGRVNYEFRSYAIHGIIDVPLTVLVKCASKEAFFPLVHQIYDSHEAIITRAQQGNNQAQSAMQLPLNQRYIALADAFGLTDFFASRGVSKDQADACLADSAAAQKVADETDKWYDDGKGINHTPTLFINGREAQFSSWPELEAALQRAGAR